MEEFPYLRKLMALKVEEKRWKLFARQHRDVVTRVRRIIEEEGPKASRDFFDGKVVQSYRARNEMGLGLYYLWLRGDLMIRERMGGEKVYDLTERLLPKKLLIPAPEQESTEHLASEGLRSFGLVSSTEVSQVLRRALGGSVSHQERERWLANSEKQGDAIRVRVDGWPGEYWLASDTEEELDQVSKGDVPRAWKPLHGDVGEAILLAPLEKVTAQGRAKRIFGFDYVWEVYKPVSKRRWGYYVLPVLYGDSLLGRVELQRDADSKALVILGFWLEDEKDGQNMRFARALSRSIARLAQMNGLERIAIRVHLPEGFRRAVMEANSSN